ncbi:putative H/ACA ribonucleoprotein complex subunit 1-like protein 1 [Ceratitis capitata]|uniref:H/ACA ribonucleoprotein complex subunit n=1 Tax=Ceratitis capitata TaxID=7213 RepID=W8CE09_CERCA|nr:putative H/ACA ribonucleoprotein complex subunit 1-like protein 1 [Ceratitis capitata]CAD6995023.1 unnamed protein product [Ceratitis capitata]
MDFQDKAAEGPYENINGCNNGKSSNKPYFSQFSVASFSYAYEDAVIVKMLVEMVPCHNEAVYDINQKEIGKVGKIFGPAPYFHILILLNNPRKIKEFGHHSKFIMNVRNLLPLEKFVQDQYLLSIYNI